MKQNMCVTIDEEIHSWLRSKPEMMSRTVNGILWKAMQKEIQTRALKSGEQVTLPLEEYKRWCPACETTQEGPYNWCVNKSCRDHGVQIEVIE